MIIYIKMSTKVEFIVSGTIIDHASVGFALKFNWSSKLWCMILLCERTYYTETYACMIN